MARDYALHAGWPSESHFQAITHRPRGYVRQYELARSIYAPPGRDTMPVRLPIAAASARLASSYAFGVAAKENIHIHCGSDLPEAEPHLFFGVPQLAWLPVRCCLGEQLGIGALEPSRVVSGRLWT